MTDKLHRANALHQIGRLAGARALYEDILRVQPRHFDALHLLGVLAAQTQDARTAVRLIDKAIRINPTNAAAHCNKGTALQALKKWNAALASYDRAIALKGDYAMAHCNRGNVLYELGQLDAALASYDCAIALNGHLAEAHSNRGNVLAALGRSDEALASYARAIAAQGNHAEAHFNQANLLKALRRFNDALASYDRAIAIRPDFAAAHVNRGGVLCELGQWDASIASYDRAIALKADAAETYFNRGNVLRSAGRLDAALDSYRSAINARRDYAEAHCNLGFLLKALHQYDAALESFNRAISLRADFAEARFNRATLLLATADFARGWIDYEWRWRLGRALGPAPRRLVQPLWLGDRPISGRTVLLHSEQGLGDTLQFCRYARLVSDLGAHVVLEVQGSLVGLLSTLDCPGQIIAAGSRLPDFEFHCPLLSLPLAFKTDIHTIPAAPRYLAAEPGKVAWWAARLGERLQPRIGLVWSGKASHTNDRDRSLPLSEVVPHLPRDFQYVSLQTAPRAPDCRTLEAHPWITDLTAELSDFGETAALCECLDLVISVDTSVAHLSGALGKPTWVLLPFNPDWRWLLKRDDSPWYPSMRLCRQPAIGDWSGVLERVRASLLRIRE
jgi:tetratricopeptide (TPR) repeat protein